MSKISISKKTSLQIEIAPQSKKSFYITSSNNTLQIQLGEANATGQIAQSHPDFDVLTGPRTTSLFTGATGAYSFMGDISYCKNVYTSVEDEHIMNEIMIFPNPTTDYISMQSDLTSFDNIRILDIQGRLVQELNENSGKNLYVENLKEGIYFMSLVGNKQVYHLKFVKK